MNIKLNIRSLAGLFIITGLFTHNASAELINDSQWLIKPGDSLYKIARSIFPDDSKKQARLRREIVQQNPQAFANGSHNISVGDRLSIPEFARKAPAAPAAVKKIARAEKPKPVQATEQNTAVTVDPEDIVGQVVIKTGTLTAENRGSKRQLSRRSNIFKGDTLSTGDESHSQLRMKDGALLSLRPQTDLKIETYRYNGQEDGSELSIMELLKGGFRTITGAIGHKNKRNYKVKSTAATIGIRGTHYSLMLCQQSSCSQGSNTPVEDGLYGGVVDGSIVIENQTGIHQFNNDQYFKVTSSTETPVEFLQPPSILRTGSGVIAQAKSRQRDSRRIRQQRPNTLPRRLPEILGAGQHALLQQQLLSVTDLNTSTTQTSVLQPEKAPNGSAMMIGFSHVDVSGAVVGTAAPVLVAPINNNEIFLTDYILPNGTLVKRLPFGAIEYSFDPELQIPVRHDLIMSSPNGNLTVTPSDLGGNPVLGVNWGRWNGDYTVLENGVPFNAKDDFHFIYTENLTSPTQLAALGGLVATYNKIGGTNPTDSLGNVGTLDSLSMGVNFTTGNITSYDVTATVNTITYQAFLSPAAPVPISSLGTNSIQLQGACSPTPCVGGASVAFVGNVAQGAITSYHIDELGGVSVTGAALLQR